jgi:glucuronokinase
MNANFDLRRTIYALPAWQVQMVEVARACGASAKFAGSGGAIVGIVRDDAMFQTLCARLGEIGSHTVRPRAAD